MDIKNKVIIVTGASGGIGLAVAEKIVEAIRTEEAEVLVNSLKLGMR